MRRIAALLIGALLVVALAAGFGAGRDRVVTDRAVRAAYARLPIAFEPNRGQAPGRVRFVAHGSGYSLLLGRDRLSMLLGSPAGRSGTAALVVSMPGAHPSAIVPVGALPGVVSYFAGSDPHRWHTGISTFSGVRYRSLWPGVDLVFAGDQQRLEYDFDLAPGVGARRIALALPGARLRLTSDGDLLASVAAHTMTMLAPVSYQQTAGVRVPVASRWVLRRDGRVGIALGAHDPSLPLTVDPVLQYAAFFGGTNTNQAYRIAVGSDGSAYVAGWSTAPSYPDPDAFPTTSGAYLRTSSGGPPLETGMAFVAKLNPAGTAFEYSTMLGEASGFSASLEHAIAIDSAGDAFVTGTAVTGYPTTTGAFQPSYQGQDPSQGNAFVTELNRTGTGLVYSTFLGGSLSSTGWGIAVDGHGDAFVSGATDSAGAGATIQFPTTPGAYQRTYGGGTTGMEVDGDAFVTELNPTGSSLVYSTLLGGSGDDVARSIALDSAGDAYVAGRTSSPGTSFPTTAGAPQQTNAGGAFDAFVTELNPSGSALVHSTLLGGSGDDEAWGIAEDSSGVYVAGLTNSPGGTSAGDFPTTAGAFQTANAGGYDGFVTKLAPSGSISWSTLLGGGDDDAALAVAIDARGDAHLTGCTSSSGATPFPTTTGAIQGTYGGGAAACGTGLGVGDAFVTELNPSGTAMLYSTYLGSSADDGASGVALDSGDNVYVLGETAGPPGSGAGSFPSTPGALQDFPSGSSPIFVARLALPDSTALKPPAVAPVDTVPPAITGSSAIGGTLTCSEGSWSNGPTGFAFQWKRSGALVPGATTSRYTVGLVDQAATLTCTVTASNSVGAGAPAASAGVLVGDKSELNCPRPSGRLSGTKLGPLALGEKLIAAERSFKKHSPGPFGFTEFCLYAGFGIRASAPSGKLLRSLPKRERSKLAGRLVIALTPNRFYSLSGVLPGNEIAAVPKRLHLEKPFVVGANTWYLAPGRSAVGLLKVRRGEIFEIGIADKQLAGGSRKTQSAFLKSFGKG